VLFRLGKVTTVRVSRETLAMLERMKEKLNAGTLDETIQKLVTQLRRTAIENVFELDKGRVQPFTEEDRGEDRS